MNPFSVPGLSFLMPNKVSPKEIEKIAERLDIHPADDLYSVHTGTVNVAAMQLQIRQYGNLGEYVEDMSRYVADAVNRRAQVVCFPAYTGLLPASCQSNSERLIASLRCEEPQAIDADALHYALAQVSDYAYDVYFHTMSVLAARHRVYIMAGSTLYFEGDDLYHRAFLFNHRGELVGFQDKAGLTELETQLGVIPASEIRVFETSICNMSILIDSDADYFHLSHIAKNLKAWVLLNPSVYYGEYTPISAALGLNMRVQESKVYGVRSVLCGDTGLGFSVEGGCAVFAPNELVKQKNGVVAQIRGGFQPEVINVSLSEDKLERIYNLYSQDQNPELMERYVDKLY